MSLVGVSSEAVASGVALGLWLVALVAIFGER